MGVLVSLPDGQSLMEAIKRRADRFGGCGELSSLVSDLSLSELEALHRHLEVLRPSDMTEFRFVARRLIESKRDRRHNRYEKLLVQIRDIDRYLGYPARDVSALCTIDCLEEVLAQLEEEMEAVDAIINLRLLEQELGIKTPMNTAGMSMDQISDRIDALIEWRKRREGLVTSVASAMAVNSDYSIIGKTA